MRLLLCVPLLTFALLTACKQGVPVGDGVQLAGISTNKALDETSGLATSRLDANRLWVMDDSGNPPNLYAITPSGNDIGTWTVEGADKKDWEDIASFSDGQKHWLLIADTGDNGGIRKSVRLLFVEEPALDAQPGPLKPARIIEVKWPNGPRDCEAVAVDLSRREVVLITKKRQPPLVYTVPLDLEDGDKVTAKLIANLPHVPRPSKADIENNPKMAKLSVQVTAADISPDGLSLAVLTYRHLLLYKRATPKTSWARATEQRAPQELSMPLLPQPEALGWALDGHSLYVSGEISPTLIYRLHP
jgi:hypothetical protein